MKTKQITQNARPGFQFLFSSDPAINHNAYTERSSFSWGFRAEGVRQAADRLIDRWPDLSFYQKNTQIYPIVSLYRQYVELTLKEMIREENRLVRGTADFPPTHDLLHLWSKCRKIIRDRNLPIPNSDVGRLASYIREFHQIDATSEAFHYPVTREGIPLLPPNLNPISFPNFQQAMHELGELLETVRDLLYADIDWENEFRPEINIDW